LKGGIGFVILLKTFVVGIGSFNGIGDGPGTLLYENEKNMYSSNPRTINTFPFPGISFILKL